MISSIPQRRPFVPAPLQGWKLATLLLVIAVVSLVPLGTPPAERGSATVAVVRPGGAPSAPPATIVTTRSEGTSEPRLSADAMAREVPLATTIQTKAEMRTTPLRVLAGAASIPASEWTEADGELGVGVTLQSSDEMEGLAVPAYTEAVAASYPESVLLGTVGQVWQTLDNCGPASVSMVLGYYGHNVGQADAQATLRPDPDVWGMLPDAVRPYVADFGLDTRVLNQGTDDDLKALLNAGVPVIVAQWLSETEPIAHYRVVTGYDDTQGAFIVNDGMLGAGVAIGYSEFQALWTTYNNLYLPIYRQDEATQVQAALGSQWERTVTHATFAVPQSTEEDITASAEASPAAPMAEATVETSGAAAETTLTPTASVAEEPALTGATPQMSLSATGEWLVLAAGGRAWHAFEYGGGQSPLSVWLDAETDGGVSFGVYTPAQAEVWMSGGTVEPVGRGTLNPNEAADLFWTGNFVDAGTYYILVEHMGSFPTRYAVRVDGAIKN